MLEKVTSHGHSLEVQLKVPILRVLIILSMVSLLVLLINSILSGITLVLAIAVPLLFTTYILTLILLNRGNYDLAALIFGYSVTLIIGTTLLLPTEGSSFDLGQSGLLTIFVIFVSVLFTPGQKHLIVHIVFLYMVLFISILLNVFSSNVDQLSLDGIVTPVVIIMLATFTALSVKRIFDLVLKEALDRMDEAKRHAERFLDLANSATEKLGLAEDMQVQSEETSQSASGIDQTISGIFSNVRGLDEQFQVSRVSLDSISETMEDLDGIAESQSANITQTSAALEQMVASIKNVSGTISSKMVSVEKLKQTAEKGAEAILKTSSSFDGVSNHLDSVKSMITLISNIASQTNLLAMNAAIEAAHAGEAGRGFAVVADEVRKLAESSSQNAKQVGETLRELITAVEVTGKNVSESGQSFKSISMDVSQVNQAMLEIESSSVELSAGSEEILKSTTEMNNLTSQVSHSVKNVKMNGETALSNLKKLGEFVTTLKESIEQISIENTHVNDNATELTKKCSEINAFVKQFSASLNEKV
jgi:methyl-accepting chemotaxis protein